MITNYFKPIASETRKRDELSGPLKARQVRHQSGDDGEKQSQRKRLRAIANGTLTALEDGSYIVDGTVFDLAGPIEEAIKQTGYFAPDCFLSNWRTSTALATTNDECIIAVEEVTTLSAACQMFNARDSLGIQRIGILNFASAKKEGGGFINGAQAQEESIARSSTIYPSLMSKEGQRFYKLHRADNFNCYYTHAMIYSPNIQIIRSDDTQAAKWHRAVNVDVVTSPAVNAGAILGKIKDDTFEEKRKKERSKIREVMAERMARILFLFEYKGIDAIVLGSFGTGVFKNDVRMVAEIWKCLVGPGGRFSRSFRRITFAVIPNETYQQYRTIFSVESSNC